MSTARCALLDGGLVRNPDDGDDGLMMMMMMMMMMELGVLCST